MSKNHINIQFFKESRTVQQEYKYNPETMMNSEEKICECYSNYPAKRSRPSDDQVIHRGSCHCGAVTFQFQAPSAFHLKECDCDHCTLKALQHVMVPENQFTITRGHEKLKLYQYHPKSKHYFCSDCATDTHYFVTRYILHLLLKLSRCYSCLHLVFHSGLFLVQG